MPKAIFSIAPERIATIAAPPKEATKPPIPMIIAALQRTAPLWWCLQAPLMTVGNITSKLVPKAIFIAISVDIPISVNIMY